MEIWKPIQGWHNYEVSNFGRVRSVPRMVTWKHHGKTGLSKKKGKVLSPIPRKISSYLTYMQVGFSAPGISKVYHVHRLVAQAFIPNPENKPQVNHKDGDGTNNHISNLEWVTVSENGLHAYRVLGRTAWQKGLKGALAITAKAVLQKDMSGKIIKEWPCAIDAVNECGFDSGSISRCCNGLSKTHKGYVWEFRKAA